LGEEGRWLGSIEQNGLAIKCRDVAVSLLPVFGFPMERIIHTESGAFPGVHLGKPHSLPVGMILLTGRSEVRKSIDRYIAARDSPSSPLIYRGDRWGMTDDNG